MFDQMKKQVQFAAGCLGCLCLAIGASFLVIIVIAILTGDTH